MKELKGIVEYLTEHNAYSEVRARKMWMDYASTGVSSFTAVKYNALHCCNLGCSRILADMPYKLSICVLNTFQKI